ncbi:MAG: hypothetical protein JOS17DRAFT_400868 [Linnemannia elongata]|nr:MAG: hypothetical protein JOS17DRAFT_400868 [Linnemannia elongata]
MLIYFLWTFSGTQSTIGLFICNVSKKEKKQQLAILPSPNLPQRFKVRPHLTSFCFFFFFVESLLSMCLLLDALTFFGFCMWVQAG